MSEEAWQQRNDNLQPFSFWRARFEPPPAAPPDPLPKENAEELFRRLVAAADRSNANACYVLAAMLERKRILKQIQTESGDQGRVLIYEHAKSGDVFVVPDPQLHLDELEPVQNEVAALMRSSNDEIRNSGEDRGLNSRRFVTSHSCIVSPFVIRTYVI